MDNFMCNNLTVYKLHYLHRISKVSFYFIRRCSVNLHTVIWSSLDNLCFDKWDQPTYLLQRIPISSTHRLFLKSLFLTFEIGTYYDLNGGKETIFLENIQIFCWLQSSFIDVLNNRQVLSFSRTGEWVGTFPHCKLIRLCCEGTPTHLPWTAPLLHIQARWEKRRAPDGPEQVRVNTQRSARRWARLSTQYSATSTQMDISVAFLSLLFFTKPGKCEARDAMWLR